jgi:hypothetical protein
MRFCRIAAVYVVCLSVWAGSGYTVEQIKQFITSAVQLKNPDKEVAETLRKMKLSERLDLDTVEALQNQGAGPKTVAVLKQLATESESLPGASPPPPKPVYVPPPPPSSEEQAKLLDEVRDYAVNYTKRLPDFICLEQTRRYVDTTGRESWRMQDIITARLSYFNQKEDYKLVSRNDKVITDVAYASVGGALSMGDFGRSVFVDKEYNTIVRITQEADNIPPTFPVQEAKETLDYDFTKIGDSEFFLPLIATVRMHSGREWSKNEKEFRLYRKFSADSLIKFDDKDMPPLPDDKTKEQPPQSQPPK